MSSRQKTLNDGHDQRRLALERVFHQDYVFALRRRGDQRARFADQFFEAAHIFDRFCRKVRPGSRTGG